MGQWHVDRTDTLTTVYYDTRLQVKVPIVCSGNNEIIAWSETSYTALFIYRLKCCTYQVNKEKYKKKQQQHYMTQNEGKI